MPFADTSTYVLPEQVSDESAVLLADILPTSYEVFSQPRQSGALKVVLTR